MAKKRKQRRGAPRPTLKSQATTQRNWRVIENHLARGVLTPRDAKAHRTMILKTYAALDALKGGYLEWEGFHTLNLMNAFAYCLCANIQKQGVEAVKSVMQDHINALYLTGEALGGVNARRKRVGRYGATGDELDQIRAMVLLLDQTAEAAPLGVIVKSLRDAQDMVDYHLNQRLKEVA